MQVQLKLKNSPHKKYHTPNTTRYNFKTRQKFLQYLSQTRAVIPLPASILIIQDGSICGGNLDLIILSSLSNK